MKNLLLSFLICFLCFPGFSQTKAQRYELYKLRCNVVDTFKIKEARYLKYDTLVLSNFPAKETYYGKVIVGKIRISSTKVLIATVDTVKNTTTLPTYMFGNPPKTTIPPTYNGDYNRWVFRDRTFTAKRIRPVSYTKWAKDEAGYNKIVSDVEATIAYLKTLK